MPTSSSTRLEAVNTILRAADETPVANLADEADVNTIMAEQTLDKTDREVQNVGWTFNSRTQKYVVDANGNIPIPTTVIRVDGGRGTHYTVRKGVLYNMTDGTSTFTQAVTLCVVELLEWEDLPEAARNYITAKAARRFADQQVGDSTLSSVARQDELEALQSIRKHNLVTANANVFGPEHSAFIDRGSPLSRFQ